jgi:group I intron endonuclease
MVKHYIYMISSPKGKVYIGRTENFNRRMVEHKNSAKKGSTFSIHKAIRKYGWDAMSKIIIAEVYGDDNAQILEESLIVKHNSVREGYNDTYGGNGKNLWRDNPELLAKLKNTLSERFSGENNGMYGRTHTEEAKSKQKEKAKGRFSLPWFIERHGEEEGTKKYNERCQFLRNRASLKGDNNPMRRPEVIQKRKK